MIATLFCVLGEWLTSNTSFTALVSIGLVASGLTFAWPWMTSFELILLFMMLYGLAYGGFIPLGAACVAQTTLNMDHFGARIGIMMGICSFRLRRAHKPWLVEFSV